MSTILELLEFIRCHDVARVKSYLEANRDIDLNQHYNMLFPQEHTRMTLIPRECHRSPLQVLCQGPWNEEIFQLLLSAGADVNKYPPLTLAIRQGNRSVVKTLIEHGANVNLQDGSNVSPLAVAVDCQKLEMLKCLLDKGADVNWGGTGDDKCPPLTLAVRQGNLSAVTTLVEHGADVNLKARNNVSPLAVAVDCQQLEISKLLLDKEADIYGDHPRTCALVFACSRGCVELLRLLFEHLSHVPEELKNARYLVHLEMGKTEEYNLFNYMYWHCFLSAIVWESEGHLQCAKMLIQSGCIDLGLADTAIDGNHVDPLLYAVERLNIPLVKLLLRANCDANRPRRLYSRPPCSPLRLTLERFHSKLRIRDGQLRAMISMVELLLLVGCHDSVDLSRYKNTYKAHNDCLIAISDVIASNHRIRLPLQGLCRLAIRKQMGCTLFQKKVQKLPLPKCLKDFVLMKEILGE